MKSNSHDHPPAKLWILDIDGTLMPSHTVDNECYWQAVNACFGGVPEALDLQQFQHVTDGSILSEWVENNRGRTATTVEISSIRKAFVELLEQAFERDPAPFTAFPGLLDWLDTQLNQHGPCVAIATGGWSHTARFKLQAAGLDRYELPVASSDDASRRVDIMVLARAVLLQNFSLNEAEIQRVPTCYVGDGIWDYRASRELGWDFVGIADGERADALRHAGANKVFCNFKEWSASKPFADPTEQHENNARA